MNLPLTHDLVFFRTYSRRLANNGKRETWEQCVNRVCAGFFNLGDYTHEEEELIKDQFLNYHALPSGRALWVQGTEFVKSPENFYSLYNCNSTNVTSLQSLRAIMDLGMLGCGTGAVLTAENIEQLPPIINPIELEIIGNFGDIEAGKRQENTTVSLIEKNIPENNSRAVKTLITVGDSRQGWCDAYLALIEFAATPQKINHTNTVIIDISHIRPSGEPLKGFGGLSNPQKIPSMFMRVAKVLNGAVGRKLNSVEICLLINEAGLAIVVGNVRRIAQIMQFDHTDEACGIKQNLWTQQPDGTWVIDPEKDALRMANHTAIYRHKPSRETVLKAVQHQFNSGEGAIQWVGEALYRANIDLIGEFPKFTKAEFIEAIESFDKFEKLIKNRAPFLEAKFGLVFDDAEIHHRFNRFGLNPCGEIIGSDFMCNLAEVHLNTIDSSDFIAQQKAFKAATLTACALLRHEFPDPIYADSRQRDPIIGISITGLFDFFAKKFGVDWLHWWQEGRPNTTKGREFKDIEITYLSMWRAWVQTTVVEYCSKHGLKSPNRFTTCQPAGTKSLLTGASPGWHPPKSPYFLRRITYAKNDPVALAAIDYGFNVIPGQSDRDELGKLLDDPFDPRCTEWLVEVPVAADWGFDFDGDISQFSALAQFDFYMAVQKFFVGQNTSATIEYRKHEIEALANRIYEAIQEDEGYISAALLARFDANETFPRLPFEPISKQRYEAELLGIESRRKVKDFKQALDAKNNQWGFQEGPAGCDSDKCLMPQKS